MAKKNTTFTGKISSEDKQLLQDVAFEVDISMSKIMVDGSIKEAKRLRRVFKQKCIVKKSN